MNLDERFMAAFEGFKSAHGQTIISEERRAGKQKAQSRTVRTPITLELIRSHLNGVKGVGSQPWSAAQSLVVHTFTSSSQNS
jgi:hypothetical protein